MTNTINEQRSPKTLSGREKTRLLLGLAHCCRRCRQRDDLDGAAECLDLYNKLLRGTCFGPTDLPGLEKLASADPEEIMDTISINPFLMDQFELSGLTRQRQSGSEHESQSDPHLDQCSVLIPNGPAPSSNLRNLGDEVLGRASEEQDDENDEDEENEEDADFGQMRTEEEIAEALTLHVDQLWYYRSYKHTLRNVELGIETKESIAGAEAAAEKLREQYGEATLDRVYNDWEYGLLNGKVSALRWVLGEEWDQLDT